MLTNVNVLSLHDIGNVDAFDAAGHAQHRRRGSVGTGSELWSFDVLETERPDRGRLQQAAG